MKNNKLFESFDEISAADLKEVEKEFKEDKVNTEIAAEYPVDTRLSWLYKGKTIHGVVTKVECKRKDNAFPLFYYAIKIDGSDRVIELFDNVLPAEFDKAGKCGMTTIKTPAVPGDKVYVLIPRKKSDGGVCILEDEVAAIGCPLEIDEFGLMSVCELKSGTKLLLDRCYRDKEMAYRHLEYWKTAYYDYHPEALGENYTEEYEVLDPAVKIGDVFAGYALTNIRLRQDAQGCYIGHPASFTFTLENEETDDTIVVTKNVLIVEPTVSNMELF